MFLKWYNQFLVLSLLVYKINSINTSKNSYSNISTIVDIGKSVEGRELRVIKIGTDISNRPRKPGIWIDGGIHAREWISPASVEYLVHELVENFELPENKNLIETSCSF